VDHLLLLLGIVHSFVEPGKFSYSLLVILDFRLDMIVDLLAIPETLFQFSSLALGVAETVCNV